jgi:hypothetical protein
MPSGYAVQAVRLYVEVGASGFVGGAQNSQPVTFRARIAAALALRPAGQYQRHPGTRHQFLDVEGTHQVEADFGQADPGRQALEVPQAAVRILGGQRGRDAVTGDERVHRGPP